MKVIYLDPNANTSQYNYPLMEELNNIGIKAILYSTINLHNSQYYEQNYQIPSDHFYFKLANILKNRKIRQLLKVISYPFNSLIFLKKISKEKPDIIHYNWLTVPIIDMIIIFLLKKWHYRVIITIHNFVAHENNKTLTGSRQCLKMADQIICLSEYTKRQFEKVLQKKITVIEHGNTYKKEIRQFKPSQNNSSSDKVTLLFLGSIKPYKGVMNLLKAFQNLVSNPKYKNLRLKIIGVAEYVYQKEIEDYITENMLNELVERRYDFISYHDMLNYINNCDLGVLPYLWGSQSGLPYLFYSMNKPLILSNSCGIEEQGNDSISIVSKPDVESLQRSMEKYLEIKGNFKQKDFALFMEQNDLTKVAIQIKSIYLDSKVDEKKYK
jgi:glycosyltransferase involved in cell wall biosynthesis